MQLLTLAPISESYDMFIALAFCYLPPFIWFYFGWRASKSGSYVKKQRDGYPNGHYVWVKSNENVSFVKTGQFAIGLLWLFLGSIFFWGLLWSDHQDVWFIQ
jgi:hypothetical protein